MSTKMKPVPTTMDNYVGIELEFDVMDLRSNADYIKTLALLKLAFASIPEATVEYEHICFEGRQYAFEVTLLCKETDYESAVFKTIDVLKYYNAFVDARCGLHVHIDLRQRKSGDVYNAFLSAQDFLFSKVAEHRKNNQYCEKNGIGMTWKHSAIYPSVKYKTMEIRMKEATLDPESICNWTAVLVAIANNKLQRGAL